MHTNLIRMKDKPATALWVMEDDDIGVADRLTSLRFRLLGSPSDIYISGANDLSIDLCFNTILVLMRKGQYKRLLVSRSGKYKQDQKAELCLKILQNYAKVVEYNKPSKLHKIWKWIEGIIEIVTNVKK